MTIGRKTWLLSFALSGLCVMGSFTMGLAGSENLPHGGGGGGEGGTVNLPGAKSHRDGSSMQLVAKYEAEAGSSLSLVLPENMQIAVMTFSLGGVVVVSRAVDTKFTFTSKELVMLSKLDSITLALVSIDDGEELKVNLAYSDGVVAIEVLA